MEDILQSLKDWFIFNKFYESKSKGYLFPQQERNTQQTGTDAPAKDQKKLWGNMNVKNMYIYVSEFIEINNVNKYGIRVFHIVNL